MIDDERIDTEKAIVDAGIKEATERFCDMLNETITMLTCIRNGLKPDYKYIEEFCHGGLIDLGKSTVHSIIDCLADDMPIDFRRVLTKVLEADERVENEDRILERIKEGTADSVWSVFSKVKDGCKCRHMN